MPGPVYTDNQLRNASNEAGWLLVTHRNPSRLTVDIAVMPKPQVDGDITDWSFKLFNEDGSTVGQGSFRMKFPTDPATPAPAVSGPDDWGVDVFDRDNTLTLKLSERDFGGANTKNMVNGNTLNIGVPPDVIWFEFSDGWVFNENQFSLSNVYAVIEEVNQSVGDRNMNMALRIVGINDENRYLAIHPIRHGDFRFDTAFNELGGNLTVGQQYRVHLKDPTKAGTWQTSYTKQMLVGSYPPPLNP
jgi:hypothetical protein